MASVQEEYSTLLSFITEFSDETENICSPEVLKEIKRLFKSFIIQSQEVEKSLEEKNDEIDRLEKEVKALEEIAKSQLGRNSGSNTPNDDNRSRSNTVEMDSNNPLDEILRIKKKMAKEIEDMEEAHASEIAKLEERIFMLKENTEFQEKLELSEIQNSRLNEEIHEL